MSSNGTNGVGSLSRTVFIRIPPVKGEGIVLLVVPIPTCVAAFLYCGGLD